jgi:spore coat protein A, manganese oxidase
MISLLAPPSVLFFNNHLTKPVVVDARLGGNYMLHAVQVEMDLGLGLIDPITGLPVLTRVYAFELADAGTGTIIGSGHSHGTGAVEIYNPTFLTSSNVPINVTWMNMLPVSGGHLLPYDPSLMMGMGMGNEVIDPNMIPIVVHLHGSHVASIYDGFPTATITQMGMDPNMPMPPGMVMTSAVTYTYDNSQQGAMLWYHDHSIGLTRLNVFAGLEGGYFIEDQNKRDLVAAGILPQTLGANDTSLMIADRSFTADGQLYFPGAAGTDLLPGTTDTVADVLPPDYVNLGGQFPTAVPEYYGDFIMVNGTAWPHTHVGQGQAEFDLVNGSDSRFYTLRLDNPNVKVMLIGTDGGLLPHPITVIDGDGIDEQGEQIVFAPGDRLQLLFDFSNVAPGEKVHLINTGAAYEPFKGMDANGNLRPGFDDYGAPVEVVAATVNDAVGQILEFRVSATVPAWHSTITDGTVLNPSYVTIDPLSAAVTRKLGVFETTDAFGRIMPVVGTAEERADFQGNTHLGALGYGAPVTELVALGTTEIWEFYNTTADAHPMHIHLGEYQVLGRYQISSTDTNGDGVLIDGYNNDAGDLIDTRSDLDGIQNLYAEDQGSQDTVWIGPGEMLRVIMKFDRPGDYVWHCHILSHEDHDMMRPFKVLGFAGDLIGAISEDATSAALGLMEIGRADPMMQGFVAGSFSGTANLGTLTLAGNMTLHNCQDVAGKVDCSTDIIANNGEWSYTVGAAAQALKEGEIVTDSVTITELDGVTTHIINVVVTGVNDAPILSGPLTLPSSAEDMTITITASQLLGNATDIDGDPLSIIGLTASSGSLLTNGSGGWTFTPTLNDDSEVTFSYSVSDGRINVATTASLDLIPVNDAPVTSGPVLLSGIQNVTRTITVGELLANASDVDQGAVLSMSGLTASSGVLLNNGDGSWDFTPAVNSITPVSFSYQVSDGLASVVANATLSVTGGAVYAAFTGTAAANRFIGTAGNDYIDALGGADELKSGLGNDILIGGAGVDQAQGGAGNDLFVATIGDGNDDYLGGVGIDTYDLSRTNAAATVNLATGRATSLDTGTDKLNEIENVAGGAGIDTIIGDAAANVLSGRNGNDILSGGGGNDTLIGGAGNDAMTGGAGNDIFTFAREFGHDVITDFQIGTVLVHDTLDLRGLGFATFADVLAHTDAGPNAVIHAGLQDITLMGVTVGQLQTWDVLIG